MLLQVVSVLYLDFNSIKVQLEQETAPTTAKRPKFQFHKGTIRTACASC